MPVRIKNWKRFQHYQSMNGSHPPWIKLYKTLLDDYEFGLLSGDDVKALVMLWLIASEHHGELPSQQQVAYRLRWPEKEIPELILRLSHWLEPDYNNSREPLEQTRLDKKKTNEHAREARWPFDEFWEAYPHKVGKGAAEKAFRRVEKSEEVYFSVLMAALLTYRSKTDDRPWCNPATWLNQKRWLDRPAAGKREGWRGAIL